MKVVYKDGRITDGYESLFECAGENAAFQRKVDRVTIGVAIRLKDIKSIEIGGITFVPQEDN